MIITLICLAVYFGASTFPAPKQPPGFPPPPVRPMPFPELGSAREYVERGEARFAAGKVQGDPTRDFEAALSLDPKCVRAFVGRGECRRRNQNLAGALEDFDKAVSLDSDDPHALTCRGNLLKVMGKREEALKDYERAIGRSPRHAGAYLGRASVRLDSVGPHRNPGKAIEDVRRVCELTDWKNWEYVDLLAAAYAENGQFVEAVKWHSEVEADFARRREELPVWLKQQGLFYRLKRDRKADEEK